MTAGQYRPGNQGKTLHPIEAAGTSEACQKLLLTWETGQPTTANSPPYKIATGHLDRSSILFQRWGTSKHTVLLNILGC